MSEIFKEMFIKLLYPLVLEISENQGIAFIAKSFSSDESVFQIRVHIQTVELLMNHAKFHDSAHHMVPSFPCLPHPSWVRLRVHLAY